MAAVRQLPGALWSVPDRHAGFGSRAEQPAHPAAGQPGLGCPYGDNSIDPVTGGRRFLLASAFAQPALGTLGTMQRNSIEGIGSKNIDLALSRVFHLTGAQNLEVRAEAFNALNWFQCARQTRRPRRTWTCPAATFGQILDGRRPAASAVRAEMRVLGGTEMAEGGGGSRVSGY